MGWLLVLVDELCFFMIVMCGALIGFVVVDLMWI